MKAEVVVAAAAVLAAGCGGGGTVTVPSGDSVDEDLARARAATEPLYYAGRSSGGLPLTAVALQGRGRAYFAYGTCVLSVPADGGCAVPVQIQQFPFAAAQWRRAVGCTRRPSLLGVPTLRHDGLVLVTGRTVLKIYARSPGEDRRIASSLRRVSDDGRVGRLPPPPPSVRALLERVCR